MNRILAMLLSISIILGLCSCSSKVEEPSPPNETSSTNIANDTSDINNDGSPEASANDGSIKKITAAIGEAVEIDGTILQNETGFPEYCLQLNGSTEVALTVGDYEDNYLCETLYFYEEVEYNGNYDFEKLVGCSCTVIASLEDYRGGGNLYLFSPMIMVNGSEADKKSASEEDTVTGSYSAAPVLSGVTLIGLTDTDSLYDIYGRVSFGKVSYSYYEGDVGKDPYRVTLTLTPTDNNWFFIEKIYMDTILFNENGDQIKDYHTEYDCHDKGQNLAKIEQFGLDNLNPQIQRYQIKENWNDFPEDASSAVIQLSFDVFSKDEFGIDDPIPAYETRYIEPQSFVAFFDTLNSKLIDGRLLPE